MSVAANQQRTFLRLLAGLRPHWHRDRNLPARIQTLLARHRAFGSRDRRLYRELIYTTLRYLPWIEPHLDGNPDEAVRRVAHLATELPATADFRAAFATGESVSGDKTELLPSWFHSHCPAAFEPPNLETFLARAPLWLRLQTGDATRVTDEFTRLGWRFEFSPILPSALRLLDEADVTKTAAYRDGLIEIQDLGSQLVLASAFSESAGPAATAPGGRWLDACAGAGGKTLQLARLLGPSGHVDAHDPRPSALRELATRATRAHLANIAVLTDPPLADYDGVLVDAPCSGCGTWRRAPHLKWTTTEADISAAAATQSAILATFAPRVRPGGRLIYATCSLSRRENEAVVATFLATHAGFAPEPPARTFGAPFRDGGLTFLPALHDTDGFFVASIRRA
jgi:16S rRNA (cytosine967-C5)-methyltransferase